MDLEKKVPVDSAKNLFFSCNSNVIYISVVNDYMNNFLQYVIQSKDEIYLTNEQKAPFFQQSVSVSKYLLSVWVKIIIKNSNNEYKDSLPYNVQSERLLSSAIKSFQNNYQKLYVLTLDYITGLFYKGKTLTNEDIEYLVYDDILEIEKIFLKYDITIKLENWNV